MADIVQLTGATGFVGRNLVDYLTRHGVKRILKISRFELLPDSDVAFGGQGIVHLAGKAHDLRNVADPSEYYQVNFDITKKLFDAFLVSDATKFIFISSVKAAADIVEEELTETTDPSPQTHYGKSKLLAENYIQSQPLPEGKSYYILRPCMIHGPGNKGNLTLLNDFVSKGIPYPLAAFVNRRSFLSIENLCFVIREILERNDIPSGVYNVADDDSLSTLEVVKLLAQSRGKKSRFLHIPKSIVVFIAKVGDVLNLPLNSERLRKLTENYVVSNKKIKEALGRELPVSAGEGIVTTARSF